MGSFILRVIKTNIKTAEQLRQKKILFHTNISGCIVSTFLLLASAGTLTFMVGAETEQNFTVAQQV